LQEQHYFLHRIIDASPAGIIILDFNECIHLINPAAEKLLGAREINHMIPIEQQHHPVLQSLASLYAGEARTVQAYGMRKFKCQCTTFVDRGFERKIFLLEEVTDDLLTAEKQAYGKVIRMMAHEVNNSIGPINSILQSILSFSDPYSPEEIDDIKEYIKIALDRNLKLNHFTRNFADIIRLPVADLKSGDLQTPIKNALKLMTPEAEKLSIRIEPYLSSEPVRVLMDQEQIEQVLINIFKNSIESIGQAGNIRIYAFDNPPKIIILDDGAGLTEAQSQHLFTPFYSTKVNGQGIGLTLTREILHHHGAEFSLRTLDNGWTEFEITFSYQVEGSWR
jgi:nitrogen fixation/metabolism regulation signal transduction histidine kinase